MQDGLAACKEFRKVLSVAPPTGFLGKNGTRYLPVAPNTFLPRGGAGVYNGPAPFHLIFLSNMRKKASE